MDIKEIICDFCDIPKDTISGYIKLSLTGNKMLLAENYKGLLKYTQELILLNAKTGHVQITGKNLLITRIEEAFLFIEGDILNINFLPWKKEQNITKKNKQKKA